MSKKLSLENGGPAFPVEIGIDTKDGKVTFIPTSSTTYNFGGMFLRDYFAGQALHYCLSHPCPPAWKEGSQEHREQAVAEAYMIADAMLAERERKGT